MKKIENNFTVSGFVGKDAEIRQFANASVARFSLAVGRQEKNGEETNRVSAFMNMEHGARTSTPNHSTSSPRHVAHRRGFLQARGVDRQGWREALQNHHVATKFYECPDKEETPAEEPAKPATKKGKK